MMLLLKAIIGLLIPTATGYGLMVNLSSRERSPFSLDLALSFGLGMGLLGQWMLLLAIFGVKFSLYSILLPLLLFAAMMLWTGRKRLEGRYQFHARAVIDGIKGLFMKGPLACRLVFGVCALYLAYTLFYIFWRAWSVPINTYDAVNVIALKAKAFYYWGELGNLGNFYHPPYPLQVPFMETWMAFASGGWTEPAIKLIFPVCFVSFLVVFTESVRSLTNRFWAAIAILMLCSSHFLLYHATISYRDLFMMYYNFTSIYFLIRWYRSEDPRTLLLASLFGGFGIFTKLEGLSYFALHALLLAAMLKIKTSSGYGPRPIKALAAFLVPAALIGGLFYFFKAYAGLAPEKTAVYLTQESFSRLWPTAKAFFQHLFILGNWNIIWFILPAIALMYPTRVSGRKEPAFLIIIIFSYLVFYVVYGAFSESFVWIGGESNITTTGRLVLHFYPLAIRAIALILSSEY
ncbi:MAG: hypothetical protein PHQ61_07400, partial [Candidatus Omnitrophica bacterium]|nr:hypothetical protein [Candidatus Omnitrophota bacterium]